MRVSLASLIVITILTSVNAHAFFSGGGKYKWWKNEKIVSEMNLSDQQVEKIEEIFSSFKERIVEYKNELDQKEDELTEKLKNPDCSREEVLQITDDIEDIRSSLTRIKVEMYLSIKSVLTPEQMKTLHSIRARYRSRRDKPSRQNSP